MYDHLGTEQVKLFYVPIFMKRSEHSTIWQSGGRLRYFNEGDELPLQTLYYKYPNDFMIFDFDFDEEIIWIIRDGKLKKQTVLADVTEADMVTPVLGVYGGEKNIKSLQDFYAHQKEMNEFRKKRKELEFKYFPNGSLHMIRDNLSEFESIKSLLIQEEKKFEKAYANKWCVESPFQQEKRFGEAIECYIFSKGRKDKEAFGNFSPKEEYEACLSYVKELIKKNPSIIEDYTNWLDNEKLLEEIDFSALLQDFQ